MDLYKQFESFAIDALENRPFVSPVNPFLHHVSVYLLYIFTLTLPPFSGRAALATPIILLWSALLIAKTSSNTEVNLVVGTTWLTLLRPMAALWFYTPEDDLWCVGQKPGEAKNWGFGWRKLRWAAHVMASARWAGWNMEVKGTPERKGWEYEGRMQFYVVRIVRIAVWAAIPVLLKSIVGEETLALNGWRTSFFGVLETYGTIQSPYSLLSIIAVGLGISEPEQWPNIFGSISNFYSIRKAWGSVWHQMLRWPFTAFSTRVTSLLRIPRGTNASSYTQLYLAFLISGLFHYLPCVLMPTWPADTTLWERGGGQVTFFFLNAVAITVEDGLIAVWKRLGGRHVPVVGYVWTVAWYLWSVRFFMQVRIDGKL